MIFSFPVLSAEEAAALIEHGQTVGFSGFTPAGAPKAIPLAIAERADAEHQAGREFQIGVLTGASTGTSLDGALAKADAISFRTPYQSDPALRARINAGQTRFFDMHLSLMPQAIRYGFLGPVHWAVVEASDVTAGGGIVLTSSVGCAPTFCNKAEKIIIELNHRHPPTLLGMHDIYEPADPPHRREIPIYAASDRIGSPVIKVDPAQDRRRRGDRRGRRNRRIRRSHARSPTRSGRTWPSFWRPKSPPAASPSASCRFNPASATSPTPCSARWASIPDIPPFEMYTEVLQDSVIRLMQNERVKFASSCSLTRQPRDAAHRSTTTWTGSARASCCGRRRSATTRK